MEGLIEQEVVAISIRWTGHSNLFDSEWDMDQLRTFETRHPASGVMTPHRHQVPYVAFVLEGGYEECSADGVWLCEQGDVVVHPGWHLHANRFLPHGCRVLNLVTALPLAPGVWRPRHRARFLGGAVTKSALADLLADANLKPARPLSGALAAFSAHLRSDSRRAIAEAASWAGVTREHASRLHRRHFGLSPRAVRTEEKLKVALGLLASTSLTLTEVALEAGFADQAHLTRRIRSATGHTPATLRRLVRITFVQ